MAFGGTAQREHGRVPSADARVGEADVDEPLRPRRLERGERFELLDRVLPSAHLLVEPRQLLARGGERRVELERAAQRAQRIAVDRSRAGRGRAGSALRRIDRRARRPAKRVDRARGACRCDSRRARACRGRAARGRRVRDTAGTRLRRRAYWPMRCLHVAEQLDRPGRGRVENAACPRSRSAAANSPRRR